MSDDKTSVELQGSYAAEERIRAAAPELLAFVEKILKLLELSPDGSKVRWESFADEARAVIAKAR